MIELKPLAAGTLSLSFQFYLGLGRNVDKGFFRMSVLATLRTTAVSTSAFPSRFIVPGVSRLQILFDPEEMRSLISIFK
jgi:hypothetical protein